jgi:lipopolysaccharide transport system permease protein
MAKEETFQFTIGFSTTIVPEKFQLLYYLNPMVADIDGFRGAISGGKRASSATKLSILIMMVVLHCLADVI